MLAVACSRIQSVAFAYRLRPRRHVRNAGTPDMESVDSSVLPRCRRQQVARSWMQADAVSCNRLLAKPSGALCGIKVHLTSNTLVPGACHGAGGSWLPAVGCRWLPSAAVACIGSQSQALACSYLRSHSGGDLGVITRSPEPSKVQGNAKVCGA